MEILGDQTVSCVTQHMPLSYCGDQNGHLVYKSLMRPENYIRGYKSRGSGIIAYECNRRATKS
jgi:hypothetical protein